MCKKGCVKILEWDDTQFPKYLNLYRTAEVCGLVRTGEDTQRQDSLKFKVNESQRCVSLPNCIRTLNCKGIVELYKALCINSNISKTIYRPTPKFLHNLSQTLVNIFSSKNRKTIQSDFEKIVFVYKICKTCSLNNKNNFSYD